MFQNTLILNVCTHFNATVCITSIYLLTLTYDDQKKNYDDKQNFCFCSYSTLKEKERLKEFYITILHNTVSSKYDQQRVQAKHLQSMCTILW